MTSLEALSNVCSRMMQGACKISQGMAEYYGVKVGDSGSINSDPLNLRKPFLHAYEEFWSNPENAVRANLDLARSYVELLSNVMRRAIGDEVTPAFAPDCKDRRFKDKNWSSNPIFDFIRQSYNLNANWMMGIARGMRSLDSHDAHKVSFYTQLIVDAMSPTNFATSNPEVIQRALETQGQSLLKGFENFCHDLAASHDALRITSVDKKAFEVGKNLAITPGKVVYQNDLMQLIQYESSTKKVFGIPVILMPAWINKYYILDLQPENSFVKWLVDQGYTVFMISWVNPDERHACKDFFSYMQEGPLAAIEEVRKLLNVEKVNMVGYCLGGTLLASTVAYLKAQKLKEFPINSLTFLTSLVDFAEAGDLGIFIDEEQLKMIEDRMSLKGYLEGSDMAQTFSMLRANDMIWSFYVNNYLLGKDPFPFDILYWNSDSTRLPAQMHSFYLRNMYQRNLLSKPGGISLGGVPIDISLNDLPTYILATVQDHIVPWQSAYKATQIYKGALRFVLSGSGHVAGVVNHPDSKKYNFWTNDKLVKDAQKWLEKATDNAGSWWQDWSNWCSGLSGGMVEARKVTKEALENAPGSFVKKTLS